MGKEEEEDQDYELYQEKPAKFQKTNLQKDKKYYVPVAYILQTETEYHDVFRTILTSLVEIAKHPIECSSSMTVYQKRMMAFADFFTHIAFLKTLPTPPFNSVFNIQFPLITPEGTRSTQTIKIQENPFDQLPHKNSKPIETLFECLDIKTILQCWKALIFDKCLILISTQS